MKKLFVSLLFIATIVCPNLHAENDAFNTQDVSNEVPFKQEIIFLTPDDRFHFNEDATLDGQGSVLVFCQSDWPQIVVSAGVTVLLTNITLVNTTQTSIVLQQGAQIIYGPDVHFVFDPSLVLPYTSVQEESSKLSFRSPRPGMTTSLHMHNQLEREDFAHAHAAAVASQPAAHAKPTSLSHAYMKPKTKPQTERVKPPAPEQEKPQKPNAVNARPGQRPYNNRVKPGTSHRQSNQQEQRPSMHPYRSLNKAKNLMDELKQKQLMRKQLQEIVVQFNRR